MYKKVKEYILYIILIFYKLYSVTFLTYRPAVSEI